jgi:hypothetical protein
MIPSARLAHVSAALVSAALVLSACAHGKIGPEAAVPTSTSGWQRIATEKDRARLRNWRKTWVAALKQASAAGHQPEIEAAGSLLDPDAALAEIAPRPGEYRCRTIKLGAKGKSNLAYVDYPAFRCRIGAADGQGKMTFARIDGSQRPIGRLFPDDSRRMIFLGTLQLGDEQGSLRYGHDSDRDMIGLFERVGPARWRIAFPSPAFESKLDVIELIPA